MSTLKTFNLQNPNSASVNIELGSDGSVVLPAGFTGGIGTNVVSAAKTDTFSTTSTTPTAIPGLSVSITPSSATSKILVIGYGVLGHAATGQVGHLWLRKDSTVLVEGSGTYNSTYAARSWPSNYQTYAATMVFLDSPATTSSVTYDIALGTTGSTVYLNRSGDVSTVQSASTITVIEVAA